MSRHRFPCSDEACDFCQSISEDRAADVEALIARAQKAAS